ncbi:hypothetical protein MOQ_004774 [Trypanosoma cruzi marinkellei]|uniref:Uncharacterized protein n=1 Tax=Trypanosoma cruzi marinkellei TaxID=85056 RepID=K2M8M3_TRYCR|nr:hypothetical protein MOQ_004774 [Trypanosoma cruzi marinkellei]
MMEYIVGSDASDWARLELNKTGRSKLCDLHLNENVHGGICVKNSQPHDPFYCGWRQFNELLPQYAQNPSTLISFGESEGVPSDSKCQIGLPSFCGEDKCPLGEKNNLDSLQNPELSPFYDSVLVLLHDQSSEIPRHAATTDRLGDTATHTPALSQTETTLSTTLCGLFSSDKTWINGCPSSDEWKMPAPVMRNNAGCNLAPPLVTPVGELPVPWKPGDSFAHWKKVPAQTTSHRLMDTSEGEVICSSLQNGVIPSCRKGNSIKQLLSQLTTGTSENFVVTSEKKLTLMSKKNEFKPIPIDLVDIEKPRTDFCDVQVVSNGMVKRSECSSGPLLSVPSRGGMMPSCCKPPPAVGCSPISSPRERVLEMGGCMTNGDQNGHLSGIVPWQGNNLMDSPRTTYSGDCHSGYSSHSYWHPPFVFSLNREILSDLHRNSPQSIGAGDVIDNLSFSALKSVEEWPPRTRNDVLNLLKRFQARDLLQHLRVVSFSWKRPDGVFRLLDSWRRRGIFPPDVQFGVYYWYTMKWECERLCLEHNGCGSFAEQGRGCEYASRGFRRKCRYPHRCLFCGAEDHGWTEEKRCKRYLSLQREMKRLGVTKDVALILLEAFGCDE